MSIKQKGEDLALRLKRDRKTQVIAGCMTAAVLFLVFNDPPRRRHVAAQTPQQAPTETGTLGYKEAFGDLTKRLVESNEEIQEDIQVLKGEVSDLRTDADNAEVRTAEIFKKLIDRMQQQERAAAVTTTQPVDPVAYQAEEFAESEPDALTPFGDVDVPQIAPPPPPPEEREVIISPGDTVRVKLLAGVNAPTDGTPYPVIFKLMSDIAGPDSSALPVGEARLIAAAQGSMVDSRALFRLTSLSVRFPDGRRKTVNVDGWIVGEDGIRGMQGLLLDPLGKAIGGAIATGTLAGFGQAVSSAQTQVQREDGVTYEYVTGDTTSIALGKGVIAGSNQWSDMIRDRLDKLVPLVKVYSGREATAIFAKQVVIDGLYDAIDDGESDIFALLD